eukprot:3187210-Rhodomonas_salina.2
MHLCVLTCHVSRVFHLIVRRTVGDTHAFASIARRGSARALRFFLERRAIPGRYFIRVCTHVVKRNSESEKFGRGSGRGDGAGVGRGWRAFRGETFRMGLPMSYAVSSTALRYGTTLLVRYGHAIRWYALATRGPVLILGMVL